MLPSLSPVKRLFGIYLQSQLSELAYSLLRRHGGVDAFEFVVVDDCADVDDVMDGLISEGVSDEQLPQLLRDPGRRSMNK